MASGSEILSLIGTTITIIDTTVKEYGAIKNLRGLPEAFQQVNDRLPLVRETLEEAKRQAKHANPSKEEALEKLLESCEKKAEELLKTFIEIAKIANKSDGSEFIVPVYRSFVLKLGKMSRVETLMDGILKDLGVLAAHNAFRTATQKRVEEVEKARQDLAKVPPSLPDSEFDEKPGFIIGQNVGVGQAIQINSPISTGESSKYLLNRQMAFSQQPATDASTLEAGPVPTKPRVHEQQQGQREDSTSDRHEADLIAGFHDLPQPLQEALAPLLEDEVFRRQVEERFGELESNTGLRQESTMNILTDLGLLLEKDDDGHDAGSRQSFLEPSQVRPQDEIPEDDRQKESGTSSSCHVADLMAGLQSLPQPLQEALAPFLKNETFKKQVEERFNELKSSTRLRQESASDLLNALGIEETDDEDHNAGQNTTSQGGGDLPGSTPSEHGISQKDDSSKPPPLSEDRASPGQGLATEAKPRLQQQMGDEKFFDWTSLHPHNLQAKKDPLESKYLTALAIYDKVKINASVQGASIGVEGIATLIRHYLHHLHKQDYIELFHFLERVIRLPMDRAEDVSQQSLEDLDTNLFDTSKFNGYDSRLTSVTYGDGKYGTITLFQLTMAEGRPQTIRPMAAMAEVPKILLRKIGEGVKGSSKTTLSMPEHEVWKATEQRKIEPKAPVSKPNFTRHNNDHAAPGIGDDLKIALSMDQPLDSFHATVPQMVTMLHHKTQLIENIESTAVGSEPNNDLRSVRMVRGPSMTGHKSSNPQIIVLAPAKGSWVEEKLSWK